MSETQIFDREAFKRLLGLVGYLKGLSNVQPGIKPVLERLEQQAPIHKRTLGRINNDEEFFADSRTELRRDLVLIWELFKAHVAEMKRPSAIVKAVGSDADKKELAKMEQAVEGFLSHAEGLNELMARFTLREGLDEVLDTLGDAVGGVLGTLRGKLRGAADHLARKAAGAKK